MNAYNSPVNFGDQAYIHQEIRKKTYWRPQKNNFPYLDLDILCNDQDKLEFKVHFKANQKFKYLNKSSTHTNATFKAIPSVIFNGIVKVTSMAEENYLMKVNNKLPGHANALIKESLAPKLFMILKDVWRKAYA